MLRSPTTTTTMHAQHLLSLSLSVSLGGSERQVPHSLLSRRVPPPPYYYLDRTTFLPITLTAITMLDTG